MAMEQFRCEECGTVGTSRVVERDEVWPVKGKEITIHTTSRICDQCGEKVFDRELDDASFHKAFDAYRQGHGVIAPNEIVRLRERYGLTQRSLAALLGLGEVTIHRYEKGSLPDEAHNKLLQLMDDARLMRVVFEANQSRLSPPAVRRLQDRLESIDNEEADERLLESLAARARRPSIYTGFQPFCPEKLMEMMVFFASKAGGVLKTKINKLLWYSDFLHYRAHSVSISGARYVRAPYGPVPEEYDVYINHLAKASVLEIEEVSRNDYIGYCLKAGRMAEIDLLGQTAEEIMETVYERFAQMGSAEISKLSHDEDAWLNTGAWEPISYAFADQLRVA